MNDFAANGGDVSEDVLEVAILLAETVDGDGYAELSQSIANQLVERGDLQRALDVAESISDPYLKDQTLGNIAVLSVDATETEPTELLDAIEDPVLRDLATEQLAVKYAEIGHTEQSLEMASQLPDSEPALRSIAVSLAAKGHHAQAEEIVESIENPVARLSVMSRLCSEFLQQEKGTEAASLLQSAEREFNQIEFPEDRINGALSVATMLREHGRNDDAFEKLAQAGDLCKDFQETSNDEMEAVFVRDEALAQIASEMVQTGHLAEADKLIEEIGDAFNFSRATVQLALAHHKEANPEEAQKLLRQAEEITEEQPTYGEYGTRMREALFAEIANAYANCALYDNALQVAGNVTNSDERLRTLIGVGQVAARSQQDPVVTRATESLDDNVSRASYWLSIAESLRSAGQFEAFDGAATNAINSAQQIAMPYEQSLLLAEIGYRLAERNPEKSDAIFVQTVENLPSIESSYRKVAILLSLAQKYWKLDRVPIDREREVFHELIANLD